MIERTLITLAVGLLVIACQRLSSDEAKLLGKWCYMTIDTHVCTVFKRDHTFTISFDGDEPFPGGTWRIEGSEIVMDIDPKLPFPEGSPPLSPPLRGVDRVKFAALPAGELELNSGYWKREN
jgi:hypothetical protein